ncbi:MAG: VWA domain-containing protein [Nitrospirota bacterium]
MYESTEGLHKVGTLTFYTGGTYSKKADVIWQEEGWPAARVNGLGKESKNISMYDKFKDNSGNVKDIQDEENGYTFGHEWGHYAYGLYDEYEGDNPKRNNGFPLPGDKPVVPSIMNSQDDAKGGGENYKWLKFSIAYKSGDTAGKYRNTKKTAQHRTLKVSAWETLGRSEADDPKPKWAHDDDELGRKVFDDLKKKAPEVLKNKPVILLTNAAEKEKARSICKINWMSDNQSSYVLVIDTSYATSDIVEDLKAAAAYFVDTVEISKTAIGIMVPGQTSYPVTVIKTNLDKERLKAFIKTLSPSSSLALYDTIKLAGGSLLNRPENETKAVFLITSGKYTGDKGITAATAYNFRNMRLPIFTIAYDNDPAQLPLFALATRTKGNYYNAGGTFNRLIFNLNNSLKEVTSSYGISEGTLTLSQGRLTTQNFTVDPTTGSLLITAVLDGKADVSVTDPQGMTSTVSSCIASPSGTVCTLRVNSPRSGNWQLSALSSSVLDIGYSINGLNKNGIFPYTLSVYNISGDSIRFPEQVLLEVNFEKDYPIAGANITSVIQYPDGSVRPAMFRDDGINPDSMANDGVYSFLVNDYNQDGIYTVTVTADNKYNTAYMTNLSLQPALLPDGSMPGLVSIPLNEQVQRSQQYQFIVSNVNSYSRGTDFSTAKTVVADNTDTAGIISSSATEEFYKITDTDSVPKTIVFRLTSISPDWLPVLTVYDSNYIEIGRSVFNPKLNYPSVDINTNGNAVFYAKVSTSSGSGRYNFSAGSILGSDVTRCDAVLDGYTLNVPVSLWPDSSGQSVYLSLNMVYRPTTDGNMWYFLNSYSYKNDATSYLTCDYAHLDSDMVLYIPQMVMGDRSYWAEFQYIYLGAGNAWFKLKDMGEN